jgi:hypothetical protein
MSRPGPHGAFSAAAGGRPGRGGDEGRRAGRQGGGEEEALQAALAVLHCTVPRSSLTPDVVVKAFKARACQAHPDKGQFHQVRQASCWQV